jgi:hypothetical protein
MQLIVDVRFSALPDGSGRPDEHPFTLLFGLAVWRAIMIEPPGGISSLRTINYPAIVQPEIESVSLLGGGP